MTSETKIINTKLEPHLLFKYEQIKERLGIQNDAEVIRFLIADYFTRSFSNETNRAQQDYDKALPAISKFMNRYGEEWERLGE